MESGARVWCNDDDEAWLLCEVVKKSESDIEIKLVEPDIQQTYDISRRSEKQFTRPIQVNDETGEKKYQGVELSNAPLSDADREDGRDDDLITLPHLHEPALLHAVSDRFYHGKIYTWTGPILIAVNPFERLPLYTNEILEKYRRDGLLRSQGMGGDKTELGPHVFAIADHAFRQMMGEKRKSQAILISGESGAGKTESTKFVMLYLTTLGSAGSMNATPDDGGKEGELSVMERVLQSNPILEAFGNAKTLRNDNSSRFGKFIELGFSRAGHLLGAKVQTYLLEKVRLAYHAAGERNYHIFYQLLRGATEEQKDRYDFHDSLTGGLELPNYFHYTGQGGSPSLKRYNDENEFQDTVKAMKGLGWSPEKVEQVLSLVAGLLHLGQTSFESKENESGIEAAVIADDKTVEDAGRLLGVDLDKLKSALTERKIAARGQEITTQLTAERAMDARDALSKTIYGSLFLWVVAQVNGSICWEDDKMVRSSCGVLDIFGFECFAINSFEQLCINYTNEALQQQFNKFVFKMEQAEYERENIDWAFIEFPDNQDCLDLISIKKVGILAMLDDECRLPRGSDKNFANRMYELYLPNKKQVESDNTRFSATPIQRNKAIFCVRHFAGPVQYTTETGFMEKNKDEIPLTAQNLFETAPSELIKDSYEIQKQATADEGAKAAGGGAGKKKGIKTVGMQFKEQLTSLIENVEKTDPHYIRCLKSNDSAKPKLLTRKRVTEQLRYGGVLEAVRVARMGFPVRLVHEQFFTRYRMILPTTPEDVLPWSMEDEDIQKLCVKLMDVALVEGKKQQEILAKGKPNPNEEGITRSEKIRRMQLQPEPMVFSKTDIQLGLTKVFMRKPPHDILESHRTFQQKAASTLLQSWVRGLEHRKNYLNQHYGVITIQRVYRGHVGRERWWTLRRAVAGQLLTKHFRMQISRRRFQTIRNGSIRMQAVYRGHAIRRLLATIKIQTYIRMQKRHVAYRKLKSAILALQCALRKRMAKAVLTSLMKEQKDVGHLKDSNEKLKMEMASLKAMLQAQAQGDAAKIESEQEMEAKQEEINKLEKRIAELEQQLENEKALMKKMEEKMEKQQKEHNEQMERAQKQQIHQMQNMQHSMASNRQRANSSNSHEGGDLMNHRPTHKASNSMPNVAIPENYVSPEVLAEHQARVARLEEELEAERKFRRDADGEIIKLRAAVNGVKLSNNEVNALLAQSIDNSAPATPNRSYSDISDAATDDSLIKKAVASVGHTIDANNVDARPALQKEVSAYQATPAKEMVKVKEEAVTPEVATALNKLGARSNNVSKANEPKKPSLFKAPSEYLPMIKRGFSKNLTQEEEEQVVAVGWKHEIRNRKEREEALRDEVHRFEVKMKKFNAALEEGIDVVMWQLNRNAELGSEEKDAFALVSTPVTVKLHRRGDLFVQTVLAFSTRGSYLSKALGRNKVDTSALDPLSLHDILAVKAGCAGFDHTSLPTSSSGKSKSKKSSKSENKQGSLFLTIKATPTPVASSRSYFLRFKSRSARNDIMNGLRGFLADMQIHEGISVSALHKSSAEEEEEKDMNGEDIMVPLSEIHKVIDRERQTYDHLLLLMLQGKEDLTEKEDELTKLRTKLESSMKESVEKDRIQANDSKLIMQLSKKLETLLMDNEDLRDQNDRLNARLIAVECEKMNLMNG